MSRTQLIIAIDGPSGAGKGTVARTIAARLSYLHIDTGAMYRAIAWKALHDGLDLANEDDIVTLATRARLELDGGVRIDGHDVTQAIRTAAIDQAAAAVAQRPAVRAVLVERQRHYGVDGGVVMEGRDIGSVVFPDADVKIYLDASPDERARRRSLDAAHEASRAVAAVHVAEALEVRDRADRTRQASPLRMADDATYIDTTGVSVDDVVERVMALVTPHPSAR